MKKLIKSFEEACAVLNYPTDLPDISNLPAKHQASTIANYKLGIIAEASNEGHEFNYDDYSERKWYPWFDMDKDSTAGSGFAFGVSYCGRTCSYVGPRLSFVSSEVSDHVGTHFIDLYRESFGVK